MSSSKTVDLLLVSIGFPPKNDPEALQVAKYLKYLLRHDNLRVSAVTSANPTLWMTTDPSLAEYADGCHQVIEIPIFEPRLLSIALIKLARSLVMMPDTRMTFAWRWRSVVRQLQRRPQVILSRAFPLSATLMAYRLQRHYGVPWIMHLSDPWTDSPILHYRGPSLVYHRRLQAKCFAAADRISVATPRMADLYRTRYPDFAQKIVLFPNVFDEADVLVPEATTSARGHLSVVYTGGLSGDRRISWFVDALRLLARRHPESAKRIQVVVAGDADSANLESMRGVAQLRHVGKVGQDEARRLQRDADVLLVIDNPLPPTESIFLPSKLLDYQATRNPILAITSEGSMTRAIVFGDHGASFDHHDAEGMVDFLLAKLRAQDAGERIRGSAPGPDEVYGARYNADRLHASLTALVNDAT